MPMLLCPILFRCISPNVVVLSLIRTRSKFAHHCGLLSEYSEQTDAIIANDSDDDDGVPGGGKHAVSCMHILQNFGITFPDVLIQN